MKHEFIETASFKKRFTQEASPKLVTWERFVVFRDEGGGVPGGSEEESLQRRGRKPGTGKKENQEEGRFSHTQWEQNQWENNPDFRERKSKRASKRQKERYASDEEFREKQKEASHEQAQEKKPIKGMSRNEYFAEKHREQYRKKLEKEGKTVKKYKKRTPEEEE